MKKFKDIRESAKGMVPGFTVEIPKQTISGKTIGGGKNGMFIGKARTAREAIATAAKRLGVDFTMLKVGKVVKESAESESGAGAGFWGTDKLRKKLQKDTPGQAIKGIIKSEETTLAQQQRDKTKSQHDAHAKRMNKSARDSIKKYDQAKKDREKVSGVNEAVDRSAISAALRKAAEKENMKSNRDVERFFDYSGGDIIFQMVKDEDEANNLIGQFKSQYKQKFNEEPNRITKRLKTRGVDLDQRARDRKAEYERLKKQQTQEEVNESRVKDLKDLETLSIAYVDQLRKGKDLKVLTKQINQIKKKLGVK